MRTPHHSVEWGAGTQAELLQSEIGSDLLEILSSRHLITWWSTGVSGPPNAGGGVTKFTPHEALKLIAWRHVDLSRANSSEAGLFLRLIDFCTTQL